jgi:Tol biopolymer transport system component/predicted Ser/Thr protein kinase
MIGRTVDQYRILSKLGQGGMGEVYLAEDTALRRRVAIKFLPSGASQDEETLARFRREAQAAAALEHPGIVGVHHVGVHEGRPYIAMAHVEGRPLSDVMAQAPLPTARIAELTSQVAEALAAAHRAGIVHRDVKPSNIMVASDGRARVLDFGLAKLEGDALVTSADVTLGTAQYMSPEQVRGERVDARSDIFSLGAVLYEMLSGRRPFGGEHREAIFYAILNETPAPPSRAGDREAEALAAVAMKALEKRPEDRYASADEMLAALRARGEELAAAPSAEWAPRRGRRGWPLALVLVAIVIVAYWAARRPGTRGPEPPAQDLAEGIRPPAALVTSQLTFSPAVEEWPSWSPDGERLVYVAEAGGVKKLFTRALAGGSAAQITQGPGDDIQPAWSPDGRAIAFVRANLPSGRLAPGDVLGYYGVGGDIHVLDLASGQTTEVITDAFNPSFAPDGSRIAFDALLAGPRRIWITDARGRNPQQLTTDASEAVVHVAPRWSPDGKRIVYRRVEKTRGDIEMIDLDTRETSALTSDGFSDTDPAWSPDGRHVYFSSQRGGGLNVWRVSVADGRAGTPEQVTTGAGDDVQPSVSPDGKRLAFAVLGLDSDLWRMPLDPATGTPAGEPEALIATTRADSRGAWSPDGTTIAFNSDRLGNMNIWLYALADGSERQVTSGAGGDYQANWRPDGDALVFFSSRAGNMDIWRVELATGDLAQLTTHPGLDANPFYSPDGRRIAFQSDRGGRSELWVMRADGGEARRVADAEAAGHFVRWFDGGRRIIFVSGRRAYRVIYAVDVESGALETMPKISSGAHMSFSPDESRILEVAGHRVLWIYPLSGAKPTKILEFDDADIRIDYPMWSPDGRWAVFDRAAPRGGDIWLLSGLQ